MSDEENYELIDEIQLLDQALVRKGLKKVETELTDTVVLHEDASFKEEQNLDYKNLENLEIIDINNHGNDEDSSDESDDTSSLDSGTNYNCENLHDLLGLNKKLLEMLIKSRDKMESLLEKCLKNKEVLQDKIAKYTSSGKTKIVSFNAGMPYFKDRNHYTAKMNIDTATKIKKGELRMSQLQRVIRWNQQDKSSLLKAIRHEVAFTLSGSIEPDEGYIQNSIRKTSQLPQDVINTIGSLGKMKFDWLKIANSINENKHSSEECEVMWNVFLHPDINKQKWSFKEEKELNRLVEEYNFENWDGIAKTLNTNRSGYQCFIRYNTNNWKNLMKGQSWTPFDDKTVSYFVSKLKVGDYVPWGYIASCMNNWTKQQVYFRWTYSLAPHLKKGKYTPEEDKKLIEAVEKYGPDFRKISALVLTNRTHIQLKEHYQTLNLRLFEKKVWTYRDDERLIELYNEHGAQWSKIVVNFPNVTRVQARQRYASLNRNLSKGVTLNNISRGESMNCQPDHTTVTYTTNTPWCRENEEIHIKHSKIDFQLINYFKRAIANSPKEPKQLKTYPPEKLKDDTKKFYDTLVKLNVNLKMPEYIDTNIDLSEKFFELLKSFQDYVENRDKICNENAESLRLRMFGPLNPLKDDERYIPPLPFNFCPPKKWMKKGSGKNLDLAVQNETYQIKVPKILETKPEVSNYLGDDIEIEFERLKRIMIAPGRPMKRIYSLRCKSFAITNSCGEKFESYDNSKMKYDWKYNKIIPRTLLSELKIEQDTLPLLFFEPCRETIATFQDIILESTHFPPESIGQHITLSPRGQSAMDTFKKRFQQLFQMPMALSRIIPPDTVDDNAFLPVLEKIKKKNKPKKKKRSKKCSVMTKSVE